MSEDNNTDGWCDWTYKGVDHSFPGNGGIECRDYLGMSQRLLESVAACAIAISAIVYAWPNLKLPEVCPCIHHQKHDPLGKRILLFLMCLTLGIELGFKFATRQMIWIGNPCHIATMVQIFILAAPPGRIVTAVFRLHMHMLTGAPIAILFPVINTRLLPFETAVYFIQHFLMLVIPFYLLHIGDPFVAEPLGDFSWALSSLGLLFIYHFVPLQILAYISHVNLNNMLCPAVSDPFRGQFYRVFAVCHQIVLILIMGKVLVIVARAFRILPSDGSSVVVDKDSDEPRSISEQSSAGDCITNGGNDCTCDTFFLNDGHMIPRHYCGDCNPSSFNSYSYRSCDTSSREFNCQSCSSHHFHTQHIVNGHLVSNTKDDGKYCRRMMTQDVSSHISPEPREASKNCHHRSKHERESVPYNTQLVLDKGKTQNGYAKYH